jgi:hypothetical protein
MSDAAPKSCGWLIDGWVDIADSFRELGPLLVAHGLKSSETPRRDRLLSKNKCFRRELDGKACAWRQAEARRKKLRKFSAIA